MIYIFVLSFFFFEQWSETQTNYHVLSKEKTADLWW